MCVLHPFAASFPWAATETSFHFSHVSIRRAYSARVIGNPLEPRKILQRRIRCIDHFQYGQTRRIRITGSGVASHRRNRCASAIVDLHLRRTLRRSAAPVRRETARLDDGHLDPEAGHLGGEGLAETLEPPLRCMVKTHGRECVDPADRRYLHDMSRSLGTHDRQCGLRHPECTEQIRFQLGPCLGLTDLFYGAEKPVARVVDYDIEPAEALMRKPNRGRGCGFVRDIQRERRHEIAVSLDERGKCLDVACRGGDPVTARKRRLGPNTAKPPGRTRYEPDLTCHMNDPRSGAPRRALAVVHSGHASASRQHREADPGPGQDDQSGQRPAGPGRHDHSP